jgi:hypothetical protein
MQLDLPALIAYPLPVVLFWVVVLASRMFRHPRVLGIMVAWTVAEVAVAVLLPPHLRRVIRIPLVIAVGVAILWPVRLGLWSVRGRDAEADRIFRRVLPWLRKGNGDAGEAMTLASSLAPGTFPVAAGEWSVAAALFRRSLLRRAGASVSTMTPAGAYARAARSFWRAAIERGLVGPKFHADAWDEGVALRSFHEEFDSLIPREALVERPLIPLGGWDDEADQVIDALRGIPLTNPVARDTRDGLVAAMTDELAVARGDRSEEALARQAASAGVVNEQWAALALEESLSHTQTTRRASAPRPPTNDLSEGDK